MLFSFGNEAPNAAARQYQASGAGSGGPHRRCLAGDRPERIRLQQGLSLDYWTERLPALGLGAGIVRRLQSLLMGRAQVQDQADEGAILRILAPLRRPPRCR